MLIVEVWMTAPVARHVRSMSYNFILVKANTRGSNHPATHLLFHTSGAEKTTVSEVLCCKITNRELGQDDLSSGVHTSLQLFVNDVPLSVYNGLILLGISNADLQIW